MKKLRLLIIIVLAFILAINIPFVAFPVSSGDYEPLSDFWSSYSAIVSGLSGGTECEPTVLNIDGTWYLIECYRSTGFTGYRWTGSTWTSNSSIASGLSASSTFVSMCAFQKDGTWYAITAANSGSFRGFHWSSSSWSWVGDSSIVSGLPSCNYDAPSVFQISGTWYMVSGTDPSAVNGYRWTGSAWSSYSTIASGLGCGSDPAPFVFQRGSTFYCIIGRYSAGQPCGYHWSGSTWVSNATINSGLSFGGMGKAAAFQMGKQWYLIAGGGGTLTGYLGPNDATAPTLYAPANGSLLERKNWANLQVYADGSTDFYNASNNTIIGTDSIGSDGIYSFNWTGLSPGITYYWYAKSSGLQSGTWHFTSDDEPQVKNLRIETINPNNITIAWENEPNMEWISLKIGNEFMEVRKILGFFQTWYVENLFKNTEYTYEWQLGDNLTAMSDYYNFNFRTAGWKTDLTDFSYRKLITIDNSTVEGGTDLENYALNLTLTDDNFRYCGINWWEPCYPGFLHMNYTTLNDIRFVDYYNMQYLPFNITSKNIPGDGGVSTQIIPNETYYTGSFATLDYAHDNDWKTQATPTPYGVLYYNYTIPVGAKTTSKFRAYVGEYIWDIELSAGCYNGSKLLFKSECDYDTPYISTYCWNYDTSSWESLGNYTSRYFYETQMTWEYTVNVQILVKPTHYNDGARGYTYGLDADYPVKLWMYYGNTGAINDESTLSTSGISSASFSLESEDIYTVEPPTILNIQEYNQTATSINVSWETDEIADGRIRYATNPWFFGSTWAHQNVNKTESFAHMWSNDAHTELLYVYSDYYLQTINVNCSNYTFSNNDAYYFVNSSTGNNPATITFNSTGSGEFSNWNVTYQYNKTRDWAIYASDFMLENLPTNTMYYYEINTYGIGGNTTATGDFTLGTPLSTPQGTISDYDEDRPNVTVNVRGNLTDMNGNPSVNVSIQYWNESSTDFSETTATEMFSAGLMNKTISVDYGHAYYYRLKMVDTTTGYSDVYSNDFMAIQDFFAGSYIEDDDNNGMNPEFKNREYLPTYENGTVNLSAAPYIQYGYWEGSQQTEDWMWVETDITDRGTLTLHLITKEYGLMGNYELINDTNSDMRYIKLTGLNNSWYTFYITGDDDGIVLNWTKPSLIHRAGESRMDESKYVSFGGTPAPVNYTLLYMEDQYTDTSAYEWSMLSGLDFYSAMGVEYWGGGYETGVSAEHSGTAYDRGQLFRGGVWNGEPYDTGTLEPVRNIKPMGANRYCFAFTDYWWNLTQIPSNNITNYYYRYWTSNEHWSVYLGYDQTRLFDYIYLMQFKYDTISFTRDWKDVPDTTIYTESKVKNVSADVFASGYDQSLLVGYKDGFSFDPSYDNIWNFGFYTDGRWTNQQIGKYQQGYVIFNLPDNTTLQGMDSDSDGISDYNELFVYYTNPKSADTDEDGLPDGTEISLGYDPNLYNSTDPGPTVTINYPVENDSYNMQNPLAINTSITSSYGYSDYNISIENYPDGTLIESVTSGSANGIVLTTWNPDNRSGRFEVNVTATDGYGYTTTAITPFYSSGLTISNESIPLGAVNVPVDITNFTVSINCPTLFNWSIETSPNIGNNSGTNDSNGTKNCNLSGFQYAVLYYIYINTSEHNNVVWWFTTASTNILQFTTSTSNYSLGPILLGESKKTENETFSITNMGIRCNVDIQMSNTTDWTYTNYSEIGHNKFSMNYSTDNWNTANNIDVSGEAFAENLTYNYPYGFDLELIAAITSSTLTSQSTIITFTATPS